MKSQMISDQICNESVIKFWE